MHGDRPVRAAVSTRYGPPDVVRLADVPEPRITAEQVLVRVAVTTVNRTDCGFRGAHPFVVRAFAGLRRPRVGVWGTEFAGTVAKIGDRVGSFAVGDRVFGYAEDTFGAHAEYLAVPADGPIAPVPDGLTFEQAAPSTEAAHYALFDIRAAGIVAGQDVLVHGATGAIGSAAVQLLAHLGARVTATCDTAHLDLVRGLGADRVIDRTVEDFTQDTHTYDVVFDAVGKSSFRRCRRLLRPRGRYLSSDLGPYAQNPPLALATRLLPGRRVQLPIARKRDRAAVQYIAELLSSGAFRPVIDRSYPLEHIVDAYRYVETGQKVGNVLVTV
jgi:NADPH:quinone reductase-like Zn-dependent oxidoreductase